MSQMARTFANWYARSGGRPMEVGVYDDGVIVYLAVNAATQNRWIAHFKRLPNITVESSRSDDDFCGALILRGQPYENLMTAISAIYESGQASVPYTDNRERDHNTVDSFFVLASKMNEAFDQQPSPGDTVVSVSVGEPLPGDDHIQDESYDAEESEGITGDPKQAIWSLAELKAANWASIKAGRGTNINPGFLDSLPETLQFPVTLFPSGKDYLALVFIARQRDGSDGHDYRIRFPKVIEPLSDGQHRH